MKQFDSMLAFSEHLVKVAAAEELLVRKAVSHCAKLVEAEAKAEIGTYQDQEGQFAAWAELADATKADRARHGYPEDEPLLRTGDLRDSIGTTISTDGMEAQVGSNSDIAVYQELGTAHIPPRSFLGGAMARKSEEIADTLGRAVATALVGGGVIGGALPILTPEE